MNHSVLIIDKMHSSIHSLMEDAGLRADYRPDIQREEILQIIQEYDGIIVRSKTKMDAELLSKASKLQFIGRAGSGVDNIDVETAQSKGIEIINSPEGNRDAVAEHTVGMILMLLHNIHLGNQQVRRYIWDREGNRGWEIKGKTVAIIGYGNVGREVAKRLSSFGCQILVYDKYKSGYGSDYATETDMDEIFAKAHIITYHIPLTTENKYMLNEEYFNLFQNNIIFINTARGELTKLQDLKKVIQSGKVIGAGLDVLENEKLATLTPEQKDAFEFLQNQDNVIFTPHIAGWTFESYRKINEVLVKKIVMTLSVIK
jgi:D-3-phosphoglycerate dehydrogenase / 2-oxoglutarate reductase